MPGVALLLTVEVLARAGRTPAVVADTAPVAEAVATPPVPAPAQVAPAVADTVRADVGRGDVSAAPVAGAMPDPVAAPRRKTMPRPPSRQSAAARQAGATPASVATVLGVSVRTCQRHWPRPTVASAA